MMEPIDVQVGDEVTAEDFQPGGLVAYAAEPGSLKPKCMVCGDTMPEARARDSKRTTCSPECHKVMKDFRKEMTRRRYCPSCLHPSTPAQREDFKRWRTARGDRQGDRNSGRPSHKRERQLEELLQGSLAALKAVRETLDSIGPLDSVRELDSLIEKMGVTLNPPVSV